MRQRRRSNEHAENHLSPSGEHLGDFCFPGFLDREEALAVAMAEFPDIKYREEDFDAITTYRLRKERS